MGFSGSVRRGAATATGSAIVIGSGAAAGMVTAHLQDQWAGQEALAVAAATPLDHSNDVTVPHPVVITVIEERRISPDPVVVHRKMYRTAGTPGVSAPQPQPGSASRVPRARTATAAPNRAVVAPAPKAPAASSVPAAPARTSKSS